MTYEYLDKIGEFKISSNCVNLFQSTYPLQEFKRIPDTFNRLTKKTLFFDRKISNLEIA